eukprot:UN15966
MIILIIFDTRIFSHTTCNRYTDVRIPVTIIVDCLLYFHTMILT